MGNKFVEELEAKGNLNFRKKEKIERFKELVLDWNKKINLTAITEDEEFYLKHTLDSILALQAEEFFNARKIIDIGTGAGFPGIILKILLDEKEFTLMDSLKKRINFLQLVKDDLGLKKLELIHARAEELARDKNYREKYDIAVSRAVAELRTLSEYSLPFVKKGGSFISMKGGAAEEELSLSKNAIKILGGGIDRIINYSLTENDHDRSLIIVNKTSITPLKYPRAGGKPRSKPL